jgi:GNAT superfamily N-acetyltransferase
MTPAPVVWRATADDVPEVARLLGLFRDWLGRSEPPDGALLEGVGRLIGTDGAEYLLAAREEGAAPEALCQLRFRWGVWYDGRDCLLEDLFVAERARGAGFGAALVEAALKRARERGARRVELDVNEANAPALALYARFGFSSGDQGEGRDLFMRRRLP